MKLTNLKFPLLAIHAARGSGKKTKGKKSPRKRGPNFFIIAIVVMILLAVAATAAFLLVGSHSPSTTASTSVTTQKWIILYVNQGNAFVSENNFSGLVRSATVHGFNTIFFQVYREGRLLFTTDQLNYFVINAHDANLSLFFALYITNASQQLPSSIFGLKENGISLDMSSLSAQYQQSIFSELQQSYTEGKIAITTTDFTTLLRPNLLILETYLPSDQSYIHPGIIAGVEPLATSSLQQYQQQVDYALANSDGVMVFDYYGLTLKGY